MKKFIFIILLLISNAASAHGVFGGIWPTFKDAFDTKGLIILGTGVVATAVAFNQDLAMHDAWVNHQRMDAKTSAFGNFWGTGIPEVAIAVTQLLFDNEKGQAHAESLFVSTEVVYGLKYATQRARPESDTHTSFPSGHTQISFVTAAHLHMAYGFWYGLPAYGLAVFTGLSRLADNAHWFSDIVAGAFIGTAFGRSALKHHTAITPYAYDGGGYGMQLTYHF